MKTPETVETSAPTRAPLASNPANGADGGLVRPLKITVYTISKNESRFVSRWMESMSEADCIAVLDTGSRDNTVDLLRSFGAYVEIKRFDTWSTVAEYHSIERNGGTPWRFDRARNDSIDYALRVAPDTDILVCTDLDEVLLPGWRAKLEEAYRKAVGSGRTPTTFSYEYVWNFNADGSDGCKFTYEKIHTPKANARWTHPVHEILDYPSGKDVVNVPGIRLEHHPDASKSRSQYLPILELSVEESPLDDRNFHYYGRELMFNRRWEDAIRVLKRHLVLPTAQWDEERSASMRFIARCYGELGDADMKELWLRKACDEDCGCREARLELAEFIHDRIKSLPPEERNWRELLHICEQITSVTVCRHSYLTLSEAWGFRPWDLYSIALWYCGFRKEAVAANVAALQFSPDNERLKNNDRVMREIIAKDAK